MDKYIPHKERKFKIITNKPVSFLVPDCLITDDDILLADDFTGFAASLRKPNGDLAAAGLAITQCGIMKRICCVNDKGKWIGAINPRISGVEGESVESIEGCLSWPGRLIKAMRYPKVKVDYFDVETEKVVSHIFDGFTAKIWQHEIGFHLDGEEEILIPKDFRTIKNEGKAGRNDPCPCLSGLKYKKCCLNKEEK